MAKLAGNPRVPSGGYKKGYDPTAAHKYYLKRRRLKGYKNRYVNSDRRKKNGKTDELQNDPNERDEEREQNRNKPTDEIIGEDKYYDSLEEKPDEVVEEEKADQMDAKSMQTARSSIAESNSNVGYKGGTDDYRSAPIKVPQGKAVPQAVNPMITQFNSILAQINEAIDALPENEQEDYRQQLAIIVDRANKLIENMSTSTGESQENVELRSKVDRYKKALGK